MSSTFVLFLPLAAGDELRWLRLGDGAVAARGQGMPPSGSDDRTVAIAPAADVTLHWAELPSRSEAQALAAARLLAAEASLGASDALHVAIGAANAAGRRAVAVVSADRMTKWMAALAAQGIDPEAVIPAPLLLPEPEEGFLRADLGSETVLRGTESGFADEPGLAEALTHNRPVQLLEREALEAWVARAAMAPPLDLRQGIFARRRRRVALDWGEMRRLGWLAAAVLLVTLGIGLVQLLREDIGAAMLESRAEALARQGLKPGETVNDADRQLDDRLAGLRGPGVGFTRSAGAVFAAIRAVPESEATALSFDNRGALRVSIATQGEGAANDLKHQIESMGFTVRQSGNFASSGGRITGDFVVTPR